MQAYAWEFGGRPPAQQLGSTAALTTVSEDGRAYPLTS